MQNPSSRTKHWMMSQISTCLDIGTRFLLVQKISCLEGTIYRGLSRDPKSLPLESHFLNRQIIPAALIVEFSLQFSAFIVKRVESTQSTPIIGDIRYRALSPVFSLESLTIEMQSYRNLGEGAVISSLIYDQSTGLIGRASYTYSVN